MSDTVPVIVATAGHVDHGKTALVEVLTGCNTDRLPQEKERGLSIDIGFARCTVDGSASFGIVDLPGHEDYIKNMVAGAASAKILLLVIAADESVMPQTIEHLEVVAQLTEAKIVLVITKIDLVDQNYLEIVKDDGVQLLARYGLVAEQVHFTSSKNMAGLEKLRAGLGELVEQCVSLPDKRDFRVFVERTFIAKGHGLVVTGIPISGKIKIGDSLILNNREVRVRGIENYGEKVAESCGGLCLAINIDYAESVADKSKVQRGNVLHSVSYTESKEYIVQLRNISQEYIYQRVTKCRIHVGTLACNASIKLYNCNELRYGATCFAHIKLDTSNVLISGDKFLIRVASPFGSIGGGIVLSSDGAYRISNKDEFRKDLFELAAEAVAKKEYLLSELLAGDSYVVSRNDIANLGHLSGDALQQEISSLVGSSELTMLCRDVWLITKKVVPFAKQFEKELVQYHKKNVYRLGMDREYAAKILGITIDGLERAVKILSKHINIIFNSRVVASRGFEPRLKNEALLLYNAISESVEEEPLLWLALGEVKEQCKVKNKDAQEVVNILLAEDKIVLFSGKHIVSIQELWRLENLLDEVFEDVKILDIALWREVSGLSRNHAVASLEYFDSINITRRLETGREKINN